jgi:EAL domain-containing protein (putative c-di-GMP-specific phosphodiesterase class I)/signal transduction histidine kinase/FixJ family two-component response regulator
MTFDGEHLDSIRAFWMLFRGAAVDALVEAAVRAERLPGGNAVTSKVSPVEDHALLDGAILHGAWEPYLSSLRARGAAFADEHVDYETWSEVLRIQRDEMISRFVAMPTPGDASRQHLVDGMSALVDVRLKTIASAFFSRQRHLRRQTEAQYEAVFHACPIPMFTYLTGGDRIVDANDAMLALVRLDRSAIIGASYKVFEVPQPPVDVPWGRGFLPPVVRTIRRSDGDLIRVEVSANDVDIADTALRLVSVYDVTESEKARETLARTEAQLHHAQKMDALGRLASGIAHDFNNILTVVGSYACMLEESIDVGDARRADASEIRLASERATALTRRLLALGRNSVAAPKPLNIDDVIAEFRPMLQRLVGERVVIEVLAGRVPPVFADTGQIEQVLMNLAINARDAMRGSGRLVIETSLVQLDTDAAAGLGLTPGRFVVLAVSDSGVGMDGDVQAKIFDPFFTTKDATQGTGLGLSIVHSIVHQAQGTISVFSKPGHGATFRIFLPATDAIPISLDDPSSLPPPVHLPSLCVLVVDDQRELRAATARVLTDAGCTVLEAATAADARRICVSHDGTIHVAILDVLLSDGRGDLLADELRALRADLEILLISGYPASALGARIDGAKLLAKPFRPAQLREAIANLTTTIAPPRRSDPALQPRVLVVDDDNDVRKMLSRVLRRAAFDVVDVDSGRRALAELDARRFDVVLSDVHMPDGDGLDLLRGIRRVDLDLPVILISGKPDVESAAAALEYGAFRYLTKPIEIEPFERVVRQAVRARALARIRRQATTINGARVGASDRAGLEVRFDLALANLWMAYQPIYDARTNGLYGVEALMRSREPSIPHPGALLDTASTLGRLPLLGRRVRHLSALALAARPDIPSLFVNLHPDDLGDIDLVNPDAELTKIAPRVILEITERESLQSSSSLTDRIVRLRQLGFRLAVDDIGAGYSGLTSFADLTPEIVKIDMSLVRAVHTSTLKQHTIRALCSLCHEVGTLVVGEGVETVDERDCLISLGCDLLQGYLLARPSPELPTLP